MTIELSSSPGHLIRVGGCRVQIIGWDHRYGWGPASTLYRWRCNTHKSEWSGKADGCRNRPRIMTIATILRMA